MENCTEGSVHRFSEGRPPSTVFQSVSTAPIPSRDQYDYWCDMVIRGANMAAPDEIQRRKFDASVTSLATPTGEFHAARMDACHLSRSSGMARRDSDPEVSLLLAVSGGATYRQADAPETRIGLGDFLFFDGARAVEIKFDRSDLLQLDLPRDRLSEALGGIPAADHVTAALRRSRLSEMLRQQLVLLPTVVADLTDLEREVALETTETLAIMILRGALGARPDLLLAGDADDVQNSEGLFAAACRIIDLHLLNPNLGAELVARLLGCSRSSLYRIFASHSTAVATYIRAQRLARFRRLLEEAPVSIPVGDLAARSGLYDTPNLSRMFRAAYGLTPKDVRHLARKARRGHRDETSGTQ